MNVADHRTVFPNNAFAQEANMSLSEYENFLYKACFLDQIDPIKSWNEFFDKQEVVCNYLNRVNKIRIINEKTDIEMSTTGRRWLNCSGKLNFPDGEICTSPVENSAYGYIKFDYPIIYKGSEIKEVELHFQEGKVTKAKAATGEMLLKELLNIDTGAKYIGEIAIGTNNNITRATRNIHLDEKIGGTVHLALGHFVPFTNGVNKSAIHVDMICDMKTSGRIFVDEKLIFENGKLLF